MSMPAYETPVVHPAAQGPQARSAAASPKGTYVGIASLGISALAAATSSSLASSASLATGEPSGWWWLGAVTAAAWAGLSLLYSLVCFRKGAPTATTPATICLGTAVLAHTAGLAAGLFSPIDGMRFFDVTVASLLLLELTVLAALLLGRYRLGRARPNASHTTNALRVVGSMFAVSIFVSAVASLGLSTSTAGHLAVPHSAHGTHHSGDTAPDILGNIRQSEHHH